MTWVVVLGFVFWVVAVAFVLALGPAAKRADLIELPNASCKLPLFAGAPLCTDADETGPSCAAVGYCREREVGWTTDDLTAA